jgi:hypothetical protein
MIQKVTCETWVKTRGHETFLLLNIVLDGSSVLPYMTRHVAKQVSANYTVPPQLSAVTTECQRQLSARSIQRLFFFLFDIPVGSTQRWFNSAPVRKKNGNFASSVMLWNFHWWAVQRLRNISAGKSSYTQSTDYRYECVPKRVRVWPCNTYNG